MSEEAQAVETEADAPLVNVAAEAQEETSQEAPIPLHDNPDEPEQSAQSEEDQEPLERPDYFPAKFWDDDGPDVEKLAKSYAELEKKFKAGKHKAPEEYDISSFEDRGLEADDPALSAFQEWSKENGISQSAFEDLVDKIQSLTGEQEEIMEYDRRAEMEKLGERGQEKIQMTERLLMKAPLNNAEREAIAYSLNSADAINAFLKYHSALTNENIPIQPVVNTPEMSEADLQAAIADPRYGKDMVYTRQVEQRWMKAAG